MIRLIYLSFILTLVPVFSQDQAASRGEAITNYYKGKSDLQAKYRESISSFLKQADSVELLLLSFTPVDKVPDGEDNSYFSVLPYNKYSKILKIRKLDGKSLADFHVNFSKMLTDQSGGGYAGCHYPIHGIRLFKGDENIFQTSFCWECSNFFIKYPDDYQTASWVGIDSPQLKAFFLKHMPIPKSELDRFDAEFNKKPKIQK